MRGLSHSCLATCNSTLEFCSKITIITNTNIVSLPGWGGREMRTSWEMGQGAIVG